MGKKIHMFSSEKKAEEVQENYFAEHPQFYLSGHFCPIHAWKSCQKNHSDEVIAKAKLANKRARQIELIEVEESEPDLDEDFDAHMAAIEAEEVQVAQDWNDWNEGLLPDEDFSTQKEFFWSADTPKASRPSTLGIHNCKHHLQPFSFAVKTLGKKQYTLYGSAFSDRKSEAQDSKANLCVFLDHRWMQEYSPVWINTSMGSLHQGSASRKLNPDIRLGASIETPTIFLDWPDMGVLEIEDLKPVVEYLANRLANAHLMASRIEIGCMGGHGRTGTLMALIMVQLGCKAEEAIKTIRKDYCKRAIETQGQEELIKAFAKEVQGS